MKQSDQTGTSNSASAAAPDAGRAQASCTVPVLVGMLVYLCLYVSFYPPVYAVSDERDYLTTASAIQTGAIFDRNNDDAYVVDRTVAGLHPFRGRALAYSAILAPMLFVHWKATFLVVLGCHLATFVLIALVCRNAGISPWWAWLVLLHPGLSLWSRTILADIPSATMVASVLLALAVEPRRPATAGVIAGFALLLRLTNCLLGLALGLALLLEDVGERGHSSLLNRLWRGDLKRFLLPYVCFCGIVLALNTVLYGGPFRTMYTGSVVFGVEYLMRHLPLYALSLSAFWPLMLLGVFFLPRRVRAFGIALVVIQLLFFGANVNFARGHNLVAMLLRCTRYLAGTIVVLCVGYPGLVAWLARGRRIPRAVTAGIAVMAVAVTAALFHQHSGYLARQATAVGAVYDLTPENATIYAGPNAGELLSPAFGRRDQRWARPSYVRRRYEDVAAGDFFVFYLQPRPRTPWQEVWVKTAKRMIADLEAVAELRTVEVPQQAVGLRVFQVERRRPGAHLPPLSESEYGELFPPREEYGYYGSE